jgi:hemerythrin-like metal-binding protein
MALVEWKDEFKVGIVSVDHEHRQLIGLINDLHAGLAARPTKDAVARVLGEIHTKIAAHFALEERVMRERRYDQYDDHKADHERLLDEIRDIMDRFEADAYFNYETALATELQDWFALHFRSKDARLHQAFGE